MDQRILSWLTVSQTLGGAQPLLQFKHFANFGGRTVSETRSSAAFNDKGYGTSYFTAVFWHDHGLSESVQVEIRKSRRKTPAQKSGPKSIQPLGLDA